MKSKKSSESTDCTQLLLPLKSTPLQATATMKWIKLMKKAEAATTRKKARKILRKASKLRKQA